MRSRVFLALVPLLLALAAPAWAEHDGETLDRILPDIRAAHPGRLSDAQPWIDDNGRTHYRIKWMTPEGRVVWFDTDARTGRVLGTVGGRREFEGEGEGPPFGGPRREDPRNWGGGHDWDRGHDWGDGRDWGGGHGWGGGFWGGGGHGRHGH